MKNYYDINKINSPAKDNKIYIFTLYSLDYHEARLILIEKNQFLAVLIFESGS